MLALAVAASILFDQWRSGVAPSLLVLAASVIGIVAHLLFNRLMAWLTAFPPVDE